MLLKILLVIQTNRAGSDTLAFPLRRMLGKRSEMLRELTHPRHPSNTAHCVNTLLSIDIKYQNVRQQYELIWKKFS